MDPCQPAGRDSGNHGLDPSWGSRGPVGGPAGRQWWPRHTTLPTRWRNWARTFSRRGPGVGSANPRICRTALWRSRLVSRVRWRGSRFRPVRRRLPCRTLCSARVPCAREDHVSDLAGGPPGIHWSSDRARAAPSPAGCTATRMTEIPTGSTRRLRYVAIYYLANVVSASSRRCPHPVPELRPRERGRSHHRAGNHRQLRAKGTRPPLARRKLRPRSRTDIDAPEPHSAPGIPLTARMHLFAIAWETKLSGNLDT